MKRGIKGEYINSIPEALEKAKDGLLPEFNNALQSSVNLHIMLNVQSEYDKAEFLSAMEERGLRHMTLKGYHLKRFQIIYLTMRKLMSLRKNLRNIF